MISLSSCSIKHIEDTNGENNTSLNTITLPKYYARHEELSLSSAIALQTINVHPENEYFKSVGGKFKEIVPISVYREDGLNILKECIVKYLPEGDLIYGEDEITDITEREIIEEIIREKALNNLEEEVPHGIKVEVEKFKKRKNREKQSVYDIEVNIICEKMSHKGIIIGKDGAMLKKIGTQARLDIENMLEDKVNLKLWVKVRPDWQDNESYLTNIKSKI